MKIGVLDYGVGNLGSVLRALDELRVTGVLINRPQDMGNMDSLILPGVGSFTHCMETLNQAGWAEELNEQVRGKGKYLLGICLGMQLLADYGSEGASATVDTPGLGFIPGTVKSLSVLGCSERVPHVGWNSLTVHRNAPILQGISDGTDFYFVHSYAFSPAHEEHVIATTDHGFAVTAVVAHDNVMGTQFHPEKSSRAGFKVISNFIESAPC